jgi:hypothetical protein
LLPKKIMLGIHFPGKEENVFLDEWFARFFSNVSGVAIISRMTNFVMFWQRAALAIMALVFGRPAT